MAETREEYNAELRRISSAISQADRTLRTSPQFSAEATAAITARQEAVKQYVDTLIKMVSSVGVYGKDLKPNYKVPASLSNLAKELAKETVSETVVSGVAAQVVAKNSSAVNQPNPLTNFWLVSKPTAGTAETKKESPTGPTGPTEPTTPGGATGGGVKTGAGTKTPTTKLPANWENKFREMFPSQAWLLDIDRTKYPDVAKLLQKGVINRSWETPESQARFVAEFNNTTFYKELATTGKVRAIKQLIGDAGFDSTPFNAFVTKAMNLGWEGDTLKFEAYREVFRKDDTGNLVNPTAVQRVQKSNDYLSVAGIGKAYFNQVSDDTVQKTLTGDMTVDDVQRQQREITKARYAHLSPLIDQGLTMDDIAASFRTQAAQLLEVDPNTIDMSRADYEVAMNFGEEGKKRVMTNGEWQKLLRTDARYGWDKTENAKSEARRLANTISQAFGRVI
jgi:hypothetical protein